jgi:cell division protein FtsB
MAFAGCLAFVLSVGVLGVLLLNTSMQQRSDWLTAQHQRVAALTAEAQQLQTGLDRAADPNLLAARARQLHLRPVKQVRFVGERRVSAPRRGAGRGHAG